MIMIFILSRSSVQTFLVPKYQNFISVCGELEVMDILIEAGANPNTSDIHGAFPLHYAAQMCAPQAEVANDANKLGLSVLRKLIGHGADVTVKDVDGRQPLMWAASSGSADAITSLANANANCQAVDKDGLTALHCAASRGNYACIETIVGLCGSDIDVQDHNGSTPLFYAVTLGHNECVSLLIHYGADVNHADKKGRTPPHCAAARGQLEALKILAKNKAKMWETNVRGDICLHDAVHSGRKDLVRWLLARNPAKVKFANNDGKCPLHVAAIAGNVEMCKVKM